jgi:hypothetical protein
VVFGTCEIFAQLMFLLFTTNEQYLNSVKQKYKTVVSFFLLLAAGSIALLIWFSDIAPKLPFLEFTQNTLHILLKFSVSMVLILLDFIADYLFKSVERNSVTVLRTFFGVFSLIFVKDFSDFSACFWTIVPKKIGIVVPVGVLFFAVSMVLCLEPIDLKKAGSREGKVEVDQNVYKRVLVPAKTAPVGLARGKVKFVRSFSIV